MPSAEPWEAGMRRRDILGVLSGATVRMGRYARAQRNLPVLGYTGHEF